MSETTNQNDTQNETSEAPSNGTEKQITDLEAQLKEQKNKYLYLYAEFETFKKRTVKERSDLIRYGHENLAADLLLVSDNLERAIQSAGEAPKNLLDGIKMVHHQLQETLVRYGVTEVQTADTKFNPEFHEAVAQEEVADAESGSIVRVAQKGYLIHGRLLRAAQVVIAK